MRNTIKPASDQIFEQLLKVFLISSFLNLFMPTGIEYICISLILGNIISEVLSFFFVYILYKFDKRKLKNLKETNSFFEKRILGICIPVGLTSVIRSGLSTLKQILIPLGFEKNGDTYEQALSNYGLISGMAMPLVLFPNIIVLAFSNLLIPEFSEFHARNENARIKRNTKRILKYTFIFSLIVSFILFIFSKELSVLMYNSETVSNYVKILAPLVPFMYIDNAVDAILKGLDKQVSVLKINIIDLISSIVLILILIPKFGMFRIYY